MSSYLERLKNINTATPGTAKTAKSQKQDNIELPKLPKVSFDSKDSTRGRLSLKDRLDQLCQEVGAKILTADSGSLILRFTPHLAGSKVDPERWAMALELEELFFKHHTWKNGQGWMQPACGQTRKVLPCE